MTKVKIDQLASEIAKGLAEFTEEVTRHVDESSDRVSRAAVKKLKATSPKRYGKYARSWTVKTESSFGQPNLRIVHARKPGYRLAHLLEKGHAKRGGGRVDAIPHIAPVEEEVIKDFVKDVEEAIKRG
ncbi:MAG: HK97 gp10 family phage protein [Firmicutes bacterium]|nr:HK97 gp10 family phage protein [Bacillota bacterium]